jgi:hypothetical protein
MLLERLMTPYQDHCWRYAMSRYRIMMALACAAATGCAAPPAVTHSARARAGGAVRGRAIEVPGLGALNAGGEAQVSVVSCASAGNCAAGGFYRDRSRHSQAWVASQVNGRWGTAIEVPGTAALNADGEAVVSAVSCGSAGNCMAGGSFKSIHGRFQGFLASERNGRWGTAIVVPGTAALNAGGDGAVTSVACASAGNCTAGGYYADGSGPDGTGHWRYQAFVASQQNGRWGTAIEVPGTATLDAGGIAGVNSVACASVGNCAAVGFYHDRSSIYSLPFVASQRNGRWGTAIEVPGWGALNAGGEAQVSAVACAPAGNCTIGGSYDGRHGSFRAFVGSQRNGRWDVATLNAAGFAAVRSVSCASAGNCAAGGYYVDGSGHLQAFVASQRNGRWGTAIEVPGTPALNAGGEAQVNSVSCNRPGPCTAGGSYKHSHGPTQGFVVSWS